MKAVTQVVNQAQVKINGSSVGRINRGLLVFVAIHKNDTEASISKMAKKLSELKFFDNSEGKLKKTIRDVKGSILLISQFTLYADCHKGTTPNFSEA
ncbi:MAG TPA: D-aminoacyl-tRNA deacylase, partial [Patescibacteria group bacterium]|nr:D-aminoacyl-tRNA deacylase [Patescibacteria group bacterium]